MPGRARHERDADDALERAQLLADRRLRVAEPHRGAAHRALARDRLERREVPQVEPGPFRKSADDSRSYPEFAARPPGVKWSARMRILVIQHDADKGLGLFDAAAARPRIELDIQFAGHGELELAGHAAVIALPGVANPDDATSAVDATRDVLREALRQRAADPRHLPRRGAAGGGGGRRPRPVHAGVGVPRGRARAAGRDDALLGDLPARFDVFQAHDYGFELPPDAVALAHSPACAAGVPRRRRARGASSSTPSRRSRCSTAGRARSGT